MMGESLEKWVKEEVRYELLEIAQKLLEAGKLSVEEISEYMGLSLEEIESALKTESE